MRFFAGKDASMNLKKTVNCVKSAYSDYRDGNPVVVSKFISMRDVVYKKNDPTKELMRSEIAFDCSFCMAALIIAAALAAVIIVICKGMGKCSACMHRICFHKK